MARNRRSAENAEILEGKSKKKKETGLVSALLRCPLPPFGRLFEGKIASKMANSCNNGRF
jgi:hypothetical protein